MTVKTSRGQRVTQGGGGGGGRGAAVAPAPSALAKLPWLDYCSACISKRISKNWTK